MVEGDPRLAEAVTHTRMAIPQDDGSFVIKEILESLDTPPTDSRSDTLQRVLPQPQPENDNNYEHMDYTPPQSPQPKKSRVRTSILICKQILIAMMF